VKLMNSLRKNVSSDLDIFDLGTLRRLARLAGDSSGARRYVIHSENLLYESLESGAYRLYPRGGTFDHLKSFMAELPSRTSIPVINPSPSVTPSA
jgi:hypothetical protein